MGATQPKKPCLEMNDVDLNTLERDPSLRIQIYDYPINQRDTVRRAYMNLGLFQPILSAFCFPCFLFNKPSGVGYYGQRAFTIDGFQN